MFYAWKEDGETVSPQPKSRAICPLCQSEVLSKCGSLVAWHWAHLSADCDRWSEPETEWHKKWKEYVPQKNREVTMQNHRADIRLDNGLVIELQHSSISPEKIREREEFYREMIWIFDARDFSCNIEVEGSNHYTLADFSDRETYLSLLIRCLNTEESLERRLVAKEYIKDVAKKFSSTSEVRKVLWRAYYNLPDYFWGLRYSEDSDFLFNYPEESSQHYKTIQDIEHNILDILGEGKRCFNPLRVPSFYEVQDVFLEELQASVPSRRVFLKWHWKRKSILSCEKTVFLDTEADNFLVMLDSEEAGHLVSRKKFIDCLS